MKWFLIFSFLISFGCGREENLTYKSKIEEAEFALNQQRFDDAIDILEDLSTEDQKVIDLISSAYAGRAGFNTVEIFKMLEENKTNPQQALYTISKKYESKNISDSERALEYISLLGNNPDVRPNALNIKYSSIQIYKISQILNKNSESYKEIHPMSVWDTCSELGILSVDLRNVVISVNRAIVSLKNIQTNLYNDLIKIQEKYEINQEDFESEVIENTDISRLRVALGKDYNGYVNKDYSFSCNNSSMP